MGGSSGNDGSKAVSVAKRETMSEILARLKAEREELGWLKEQLEAHGSEDILREFGALEKEQRDKGDIDHALHALRYVVCKEMDPADRGKMTDFLGYAHTEGGRLGPSETPAALEQKRTSILGKLEAMGISIKASDTHGMLDEISRNLERTKAEKDGLDARKRQLMERARQKLGSGMHVQPVPAPLTWAVPVIPMLPSQPTTSAIQVAPAHPSQKRAAPPSSPPPGIKPSHPWNDGMDAYVMDNDHLRNIENAVEGGILIISRDAIAEGYVHADMLNDAEAEVMAKSVMVVLYRASDPLAEMAGQFLEVFVEQLEGRDGVLAKIKGEMEKNDKNANAGTSGKALEEHIPCIRTRLEELLSTEPLPPTKRQAIGTKIGSASKEDAIRNAIRDAKKIKDPLDRNLAICRINLGGSAAELMEAGADVIGLVYELREDPVSRLWTLEGCAAKIARAGMDASKLVEEIIRVAKQIRRSPREESDDKTLTFYHRANWLNSAAIGLERAGIDATELIKEIVKAAKMASLRPFVRGYIINELAEAQARAGRYAEALKLAKAIGWSLEWRDHTIMGIAEQQAKAGNIAEAKETAMEIWSIRRVREAIRRINMARMVDDGGGEFQSAPQLRRKPGPEETGPKDPQKGKR